MTTTTTIVTNWLKTNYGTVNWTVPKQVGVRLYARNPSFTDSTATKFAGFSNLTDLDSNPEWVPVGATLTSKVTSTGSATNLYLKKVSVSGTLEGLQVVDSSGVAHSVEDDGGWYFDTDPTQEVISAAVFYLVGTYSSVVNPILFATTQGIGENTVAHYKSLFGQYKTGAVSGKQYVIGYDTGKFSKGYTFLSLSTPIWEGAHAQHIWIQPQRINFAANPSFEKAGSVYWRAGRKTDSGYEGITSTSLHTIGTTGSKNFALNKIGSLSVGTIVRLANSAAPVNYMQGAITSISLSTLTITVNVTTIGGSGTVTGWNLTFMGAATLSRSGSTGSPAGVGGTIRPYCGKVLSSGGPESLVLESNLFPKVNNWYSISFYASGDGVVSSGTGSLYFGIVARPSDSSSATYIRNKVAEKLEDGTATSGFRKFTALVQIPDDISDLMLRIEYSGTTLWVDDVLVEPHEGQYEYFDGSSVISFSDDFRWMGGSTYANTHFSLWYNNYKNTRARLLGDYDTLDNLYKPGLAEEWSPTGANITAHWDAVTNVTPYNWVGDAFYPIKDVNGTAVSTISNSLDFTLGSI